MNCFTTFDAVAINGAGGLALVSAGWSRFRGGRAGLTSSERQGRTWHDNAAFVAGLGLEPTDVLGAHPSTTGSTRAPRDTDPEPSLTGPTRG